MTDEHKYDALKLENQLCFPLYAASREVVKRYRPFLEPLLRERLRCLFRQLYLFILVSERLKQSSRNTIRSGFFPHAGIHIYNHKVPPVVTRS